MADNTASAVFLEIGITGETYSFDSPIVSALDEAEAELALLEEAIRSIEKMKSHCDKTDYILSACSGALCGIIDVF